MDYVEKMNYYVLLTIPAPHTKFYIEVGLDYEIPFHPNLTDELEVAGFPCKINEIRYNLDSMDYVMMSVEAIDNLFVTNGRTPQYIHERMQQEWQELKEWVNSSQQKIILNGYYMHPERPYEEEKD